MVISCGVHPHWRAVVKTFAFGTGHDIVEVPLKDGLTDWSSVDLTDAAAIIVAYPNVLGVVEDLSIAKAHSVAQDALFVVAGDPVSAGILKTAGEWGADVYVGEGQPFGTALSFGGPFLGLFACTEAQIRRLPGRIVGETVDSGGRRAFVTTLRAREQDIRREKATSNICSNQTLMAVTAAIQLGYLGTHGLVEVATRCAQGAHYLFDQLVKIPGVSAVSSQPFVREFAVRLPRPAEEVLTALADQGILGGLSLRSLAGESDGVVEGSLADVLLVAVTERRTKVELDAYAAALGKVLS
jgi:glycine dehydrogenase subunit 1